MAAAGIRALQVVQAEPERRTSLLHRADCLRARLCDLGWLTGDSASQIVPIYLGVAKRTVQMATALRTRGFLVPGIRPPTVPHGQSLLRISLSCDHSDETIHQLLDAIQACSVEDGIRVPRRL